MVDIKTGDIRQWYSEQDGGINCVIWSPDSTKFATGAYGGSVRIWDVKSTSMLGELIGHRGQAESITWSTDGTRLASTGAELIVWDSKAITPLKVIGIYSGGLAIVDWRHESDILATASGIYGNKTIQLWNANTGLEAAVLTGHDGAVIDVDWSPDGIRLASVSLDGTIRLWPIAWFLH